MATVAEIRARSSARLAHLVLVEGLAYGFTDCLDIAGTDYCGDGRTILPGLGVPNSIVIETDPKTGLLRENRASFQLTDTWDDQLAALFRGGWDTSDLTQIFERISSKKDLTLNGGVIVTNPLDLNESESCWGKHIGLERIGPAGERRYFYITPDDVPPGMDHPYLGDGAVVSGQISDTPALYLSDSPYDFAGRRVALYQIVYDPETGIWPSWSDQYDGESLIWHGTMLDRGRMVEIGKFEIDCAGPESWQRKTLNVNRKPTWRTVLPPVNIEASERAIGVWFEARELGVINVLQTYEASLFDEDQDLGATDDTAQEIASAISAVVAAAANGTNTLGAGSITQEFDDPGFPNTGHVTFGGDTATVSFDGQLSAYATFYLCLHKKVWSALGWDPTAQGLLEVTSKYYCEFLPLDPSLSIAGHDDITQYRDNGTTVPDWGNYFIAAFRSYDPADPLVTTVPEQTYSALYPGGVVSLLPTAHNVPINMDGVYLESQTAIRPSATEGPLSPPANAIATIDGTPVDSMGWFVFSGQIARGSSPFADVEFEDYAQVARCSWVNNGGAVAVDGNSQTVIRIEKWEDPRAFGLPYKRMMAPWLSGGETTVQCAPIAVLAQPYPGSHTEPDLAHRVLTRTLLSTGTSNGFGIGYIQDPGDNQPAGVAVSDPEFWGGDLEIADLGLAIPESCIDFDSFTAVAEGLDGGIFDPLNRCKYAYLGPFQAEDLISSLMSARAWGMSYKKLSGYKQPKFGAFDVVDELNLSDTEITLTESDKAGDANNNKTWVSPVDLRWSSPVDKFKISTRSNVIEGSTIYEETKNSLDRGARGRSGRIEHTVSDPGLSDPVLMPNINKWRWRDSWTTRFAQKLGEKFAKRSIMLSMRISAPKGQYCYPGTVVRLTDPRILNPRGSYGVTAAMGRVLRAELHLAGKWAGCVTAGIWLQEDQLTLDATVTGGRRLWAPIGRVHAHDSTGKVLYLTGPWGTDWLGLGSGHVDADGFAEPSFSTYGGTGKIKIVQMEGSGSLMSTTWTADISSVNTTTNTITYTGESGTLYRDTLKLVYFQPYEDHTSGAWPRELFQVFTESVSDEFGTGPTKGWRLG